MKLPAIRGNIGIWRYYISNLSFSDINEYVKKIDDELHKSKALSDLLQRSITKNYIRIKDYLLTQEERFFNALVLAVYDGEPKWIEIELNYGEEEFFNLGMLQLTGEEKIFPVDGQHRVEGIKAALKEKPELANEKVPVILIAHQKDKNGMERTRRLFSTLNRYAKPVSMRDIIALDEDDIIAIVTRDLLENHDLFKGKRIVDSRGKSIPDNNKIALTSIIALYNCNNELLNYFRAKQGIKIKKESYLKRRPPEEQILNFKKICFNYWNMFAKNFIVIQQYLSIKENNKPAQEYRNKAGGNLLFRPIGLIPFTAAIVDIRERTNEPFGKIITNFNNVNFTLNERPWKQVLWNDVEKKMLRSANSLVKLLLIYLYDKNLLSVKESKDLELKYLGKLGYENNDLDIEELIESKKLK